MTTDGSQLDPSDWPSLYAAGALSDAERAYVEQEMGGAPVADFAGVIEALAGTVSPVEPRRTVREALLRRAGGTNAPGATPVSSPQVWRDWPASDESDDLYIMRSDQGAWEETGVVGVVVRRLFVDRARDQMTALVRMSPGAAYPRHEHAAPEECLVLEGDLHVGDTVLRKGDFQRAARGSRHGVQFTEQGCLLMVTSSLSDEIL
ncbi:MAG: cupin domain-containing protein [Planctomycetes bacterium]|nr:cupin domain-containing protein [Planctomycetota bacterium]